MSDEELKLVIAVVKVAVFPVDYFQAVNAPFDRRLTEAIEIVRSSRREDGRWSLQHSYKGKTYFELERLGAPSRWNTLRALRVLKWWDRGRPPQEARSRLELANKAMKPRVAFGARSLSSRR